jgi:hypothetical protein
VAIKACMADAVSEGKPYAKLKTRLEGIAADAAVPPDQLFSVVTEAWSEATVKQSLAQPLSEHECSAILDVLKAAGITQDSVSETPGLRAMFFSWRIWMVLHDQIEPYNGPIQFNLQPGEVPVSGIANVLLSEEQTRSSYVGNYAGASIRIASGLYYHFGGIRGHREQVTSLQEVDYGCFLVTTRAVYFGGTEKGFNFRLPYSQVVRFQPYSDAVGICKNGGREKIFAPQQVSEAGWFLFNILQALAAKDSETRFRATS